MSKITSMAEFWEEVDRAKSDYFPGCVHMEFPGRLSFEVTQWLKRERSCAFFVDMYPQMIELRELPRGSDRYKRVNPALRVELPVVYRPLADTLKGSWGDVGRDAISIPSPGLAFVSVATTILPLESVVSGDFDRTIENIKVMNRRVRAAKRKLRKSEQAFTQMEYDLQSFAYESDRESVLGYKFTVAVISLESMQKLLLDCANGWKGYSASGS